MLPRSKFGLPDLSGFLGNGASTPSKPGSKKDFHRLKDDEMSPSSDEPVIASFDSEHLTIGAGVAIFHLASERVVVCYHPKRDHYFLPKGRRDANEETGVAAEREGYEEVRRCCFLEMVTAIS